MNTQNVLTGLTFTSCLPDRAIPNVCKMPLERCKNENFCSLEMSHLKFLLARHAGLT